MVGRMLHPDPLLPFGSITIHRGELVESYTGRVIYVERGVRVFWLDSEVGPDDKDAIARRSTRPIFGKCGRPRRRTSSTCTA